MSVRNPAYKIPALLALLWVSSAAIAQTSPANRIPIRVAEPSGITRTGWPVTSGIPFPRGLLPDASKVRLVNERGTELPLQTRVLARWIDKSVRWLLVDFQADMAANGTFQGWLELGKARAEAPKPMRYEKLGDGTVRVATGAVNVVFDPAGRATLLAQGVPVLSPFCESKIELIEFSTYESAFGPSRGDFTFKADDGEVALEEAGPVRCVVRLKGWHLNDKGERVSPSTLRFELYRGLPLIRVMHTFVMSENPNEVMIKHIQLDSTVAGAKGVTCTLGAEKPTQLKLDGREAAFILQKDVGELHYPHLNQREPQCQAVHDIGWKKVLNEGKRAQGWLDVRSGKATATFALPYMREEWPKGLRAQADGRVTVGLWPDDYKPWDMRRVEIQYPVPNYFLEYLKDSAEARHWRGYMAGATMLKVSAHGLARTHDVYCYVGVPDAPVVSGKDLARIAEKPLYAYATPEWFCDSYTFGRMWPHDPKRFAKQEAYLEKWLTWTIKQQQKWKWYGILDWGGIQYVVRSPRYSVFPKDDRWWRHSGKYGWFNSGHTQEGGPFLEGLCQQYARTGDRRYLDFAVIRARHKMDVDTIHYYPSDPSMVGGMRRHSGFDHFAGNANPAGAHTLNNGLFEVYFLTGYQRARDVAQLVSDAKMRRDLSLSETRSGITDINSYIYSFNLTHEAKYLDRVKAYLKNHAERQEQSDWAKLWISYFTSPVREILTCGDEETIELARDVFLTEEATFGRRRPVAELALAYELDPNEYNDYMVQNRFQKNGGVGGWPPRIMNSAGILNALPHFMWAVADGRKRFGDVTASIDDRTRFTLSKDARALTLDISELANRNPLAVDMFDRDSLDTTHVPMNFGADGIYRFDFGPLDNWEPTCAPVAPKTNYPSQLGAPIETKRNLVGLPFGSETKADGVPFRLLSPQANAGKAVLVLEPNQECSMELPDGTSAVHFLGHVSGRIESRQTAGCEYEFTLMDNQTVKKPLVYGLDYCALESSRVTLNARDAGKLKHYVFRSPGPAIRSMKMRDLGQGHQFLLVAVTAEVPGKPRTTPTPAKKPKAESEGFTYGMRGRVRAHNHVGEDSRAAGGLALIQATLPDWKTNRLLTDSVGILESLGARHFIAHVPNGVYEATAWFSQPYKGCKNIFYVKAQDKMVFDRITSSYEVAPGRSFRVEVTDGKFDMEIGIHESDFEKNAHWGIRALELRRVGEGQ